MRTSTRIDIMLTRLFLILLVALPTCAVCRADSAISLLSGFDRARIESVYPPQDDNSAGELAKLVYRLRAVDREALRARISAAITEPTDLGDAIGIDGEIREVGLLKVPPRLVEFLELTQLQVLVIKSGESNIRVVTAGLPSESRPGDRVSGVGVVIEVEPSADSETDGELIAIAAARLQWYPKSTENAGWKLLSNAGVDVSLLADVGSRNRRPLLAEDGDTFYTMLAAADVIGDRSDAPVPSAVEPITLLQAPQSQSGQWLRMDLETIQVTRIAVPEPHRQAQLGSDHYYQIDAVGDLGNVVVRIERTDGDDGGPPATFANRYPVSVVTRDLPEFLSQRIRDQEGGDAVVSQIKLLIGVDAFFYRLWSYSTDFMTQHGGGEQFGPLLVAATIRDQEPTSSDPLGVAFIGWIAAVAVISAIVAIWFWNRRLRVQDQQVRERRKELESENLQLP